ncbi:MAG: glycoside hydrolase family 16 protein [Candidatus Methylacidiphilales bacterium]|nr:glycoside hydrolase family 16 protein [Candidatus Methylacidiphilales bacterium]
MKKTVRVPLNKVVCFLVGLPAMFPLALPAAPPDGSRLVWSDEFDGTVLDRAKWVFRTDSKHWSTQKPENVTVEGGVLKLHLKKESSGNMSYTGGGIISRKAFQYGYYEARLKIPPGGGWHTSFWMMAHNGSGGTGPGAAHQELDVIENDSIHKTSYGVNIHRWKGEHIYFGGRTVTTPDLSARFHVFGCLFTPTTVRYDFEGKAVQTVDVANPVRKDGTPFVFEHGPQHVWLTSIASHLGGTKQVDDAALPSVAEFDYVRVYALPDAAP